MLFIKTQVLYKQDPIATTWRYGFQWNIWTMGI